VRFLWLLMLFLPGMLSAASYTLPGGPLPGGCTAAGSTVTCGGWVTLNSNDTVQITGTVIWNLNGAGGFNGAQINVGGNPANLTINVNGSLNVGGNNARVVANITASNIYGGGANNSRFTGQITLAGQFGLGSGAQVTGVISAGSIQAGSGVVINANVTTTGHMSLGVNSQVTGQLNVGSLESGNNNTFTGNIQSSGTVTINQNSTVNGNITANVINIRMNSVVNGGLTSTGNTNLSQGATINGSVNSGGQLNASNPGITITGNVVSVGNANLGANMNIGGYVETGGALNGSSSNITIGGYIAAEDDVNAGSGMTVGGNITAGGSLNAMNSGIYIDGNVTVGDAVYFGADSMIEGNIEATGQVSNNGIVQGNINTNGNVYLGPGGCQIDPLTGRYIEGEGCVNGYINAGNDDFIQDQYPDQVTGPVCDENTNEGPCSGGGPTLHHYLIEYTGQPSTCAPFDVQVRACGDISCTTQPQLSGTVTVQAAGIQTYSNSGSFTNSVSASTSLSFTTAGLYTLGLTATPVVAPNPVQCSGGVCNVTASDAQLVLREVGETEIRHQIAGVAFALEVDASSCGSTVTGTQTLNLSLECLDPGLCNADGNLMEADSVQLTDMPVYTGLQVGFDSNGIGIISNMVYEDVGSVRLHASMTTGSGSMVGSSNDFVVRPDAIDLVVSNAHSPQIVGRAGDDLEIVLTALSRSGQVTPNFGRESTPQTLTLAPQGSSVVPAGGVEGSVSILDDFVLSGDGEFTSPRVRYSEAGTALFTAHVDSVGRQYLNAPGAVFTAHSVGRFVPWQYVLENSTVTAACSASSPAFSYLSQPFNVSIGVSARNRSGGVTQNYPDIGTGADVTLQARDQDSETVLTDRVQPLPLALLWGAGQGTASSSSIILGRRDDLVVDGPFEDVSLGVRLDWEAEGPEVPMYLADFHDNNSDCADDSSCNAVSIQENMRFVYGRMVLMDTYGPETSDVPISLQAHYWDGERFRINNEDLCTDIDPDNLQILENISELDTSAAGFSTMMLSGQAPAGSLRWTAPDAPGEITFSYEAPAWLKTGDDGDEDPVATANFGAYGGHDRVQSWKLLR
jgi:MSHA biogenesis protein MshQ